MKTTSVLVRKKEGFRRFTVDKDTVTVQYADGRVETKEYLQRAKRAVDILRERRKTQPDQSVSTLKTTLDQLEAELAQRKAEKAAELEAQQKARTVSICSLFLSFFKAH
jgi:hypothetical protein